jgi:hypothetical protein
MPIANNHSLAKNHGFMLIELLIAISLSFLLLSILTEIYVTAQKSYHLQIALQQIQTHAQLATDILTSEIQQAGHIGCAKLTADFPILTYSSYPLTPQTKLIGTDHMLTVRYVEFPAMELMVTMHDAKTLYVNKGKNYLHKILVISDCSTAEMFIPEVLAQENHFYKITPFVPLHHLYAQHAEIGKLVINSFYIQKTKRLHQDGTPIYALYRQDIQHRKIALVEGVEQMNIQYSIKQNNTLINLPANAILDWQAVVGVAIDLQISEESLHEIWHVYVPV